MQFASLPSEGNLYQKFSKLPCLPKADILSIPACRQVRNYGTNIFQIGSLPSEGNLYLLGCKFIKIPLVFN